jgi:SAM-dependent methyltransferase
MLQMRDIRQTERSSSRERARRAIENRIYRDAMGEPPEGKWKALLPLLTERGFATRVIRKRLKWPTSLDTTDRQVLEERIFPYWSSNPRIRRILFVGCDFYTAHYRRRYFPRVDYITLEPDSSKSRYGAERHVIAPLEELANHFPRDSFDLVICNGVFGWGLDTLEQCDAAFAQCHDCLSEDGLMLFGWDDISPRVPVPLEQIPSLQRFRKYVFPEFASWRYVTETPFRHTYDFYQK